MDTDFLNKHDVKVKNIKGGVDFKIKCKNVFHEQHFAITDSQKLFTVNCACGASCSVGDITKQLLSKSTQEFKDAIKKSVT